MIQKKFTALLAAVLLLLPLLFACGGGGSESSAGEKLDPGMGFAFSVTFGKNTFTAEKMNTEEYPENAVVLYTRDYTQNGKYSVTAPGAEGRTLITVGLLRKGNSDEFSVIKKQSGLSSAEIPVNGFVLSVPNAALENVRCGEGSIAEVTGYDMAVNGYEEHSYANFTVTDKGQVSTRRINIVDPLSPTRENRIYLITEDYQLAARFPAGATAVTLKKITSHGYEITDIAPAAEESAPQKGEAKLIYCGDYNNAYSEYYFKKGTKIMLNSLDKANGYSDIPSMVINGQVIEFTSANSNLQNVSAGGVYYYDVDYVSRVTPAVNGMPRKDIVVVDGYVASVSGENDRTLIPDGNGFVLTLAGEEAMEKYSGINAGDHTDTFYTDFVPTAEKYVKIDGATFIVDIIDGLRQPEGVCVLYTHDFGASTKTNQYGAEIVVAENKVVSVELNKGDASIPENGYVISVHRDNAAYYAALEIKEGTEATLHLSSDYSVNLLDYNGMNSVRREDQLIVYKNAKTTGTNVYGYEIIVDADGVVTGESFSGNSAVPKGGFVLSGHGKSADLLKEIYILGEKAALDKKAKKVIIVRTPDLKITAAYDKYSRASEGYEKALLDFANIDYAAVSEKLGHVKSLLEGADESLKEYDYLAAASKADEATLALKFIDYDLIPTYAYENRAMWYRSNEKNDDQVRETLEKMKSLNVNALYLETWYDGNCVGFVDVDGVGHPSVNGDYDALEAFIRIGREYGIEIHAWVENFFVGYTQGDSYTSELARKFSDKLLLDKKGRNYFYYHENASFVFLNPYDKECRDTVLSVYRELVTKYDLAGIHLDYIRFPELNYIDGVSDFGYNEDIIAGFRAETGISGDPREFAKNSAEQKAWIDFRCGIISSFVKEVRDAVLAIKPDLWISAATYPDVKMAHDSIFQDMSSWAKNGWIDELFSMTYSADNAYVREDAGVYAGFCNGNCFYSTGIAAFSETEQGNFAHQMTEVRECGADGVAIFSLANIYPYTYQYEIQKGAFREPSVQSYKCEATVAAAMRQMQRKLSCLKDMYKSITGEQAEKISAICADVLQEAEKFGAADPSLAQKIKYCGDTVDRLNAFGEEIKNVAGDNAETRDLCKDVDALIYVLQLTAKRLSAR
ncbi:MAG: family 10 glycosylhydrolase [Clostridia bacterium]|nr:family 10 glycosylhydrolase [Clostridia bacterium]